MKLLSAFKSTVVGVGRCIGGGTTGGPAATSAATSALADAINAAQIISREPDEDGHRTFVISGTLRGSFLYSREEAIRRIRIAFPGIPDDGVRKAVSQLENRVRLQARSPEPERRNWMHGWRN